MNLKPHAFIAVGLCLAFGSARAADRAAADCTEASSPARMVAACTRLLHRRNLTPRLVAMILRNRGMGFESGGDVQHAFADFNASAQTDPTFAVAFESRGLVYKQVGDLDHAFADFDAAVHLDATVGTFVMNRGVIWLLKGHPHEALQDLDTAVRLDPTNMSTYANRAAARNASGDKIGALADLDVVQRARPGDPQVAALRDKLASEIQSQGGTQAAQASPPAPAPIDPTNAVRERNMALFGKGAYKEALQAASDNEVQVRARFGPDTFFEAYALETKGIAQNYVQDFQGEVKSYEEALAIAERLAKPVPDFRLELKNNLAGVYADLGRYAEADKLMDDVVAGYERRYGAESGDLAGALNTQVVIDFSLAHYAIAEARETRAVAIWQKLSLDDPMAGGLDLLGSINRRTGRNAQAEAFYARALAIEQKVHGTESKDVAMTLGNLGILYADEGRYSEAEQTDRRVVAIFEKVDGPDSPSFAESLADLGTLLSKERHDSDAQAVLHRALVIQEKAFGPDSEKVAVSLDNLADVLERVGRDADAERLYRRALTIDEKTFGPDHPNIAIVMNNLADTLEGEGRAAEAEALYRRSLAIDEKAEGKDNPDQVGTLANIAISAYAQGHLDDAQAQYERALAIVDKSHKPDPETLDNLLFSYALFLKDKGDLPKAEALATRALTQAKASFGPDHVRVANDLGILASLDNEQNRWADALPLWQQASEIALKAKRVEGAGPGANDTVRLAANASKGFVPAAWHVAASDPTKASALAETAFVAAQQAQSSVAGTALEQMAARFGAGNNAISTLVRRQQDLSSEAKVLGDKLTAALGATSAKVDETQLTALRAKISETDASLDTVGHEIATAYPQYAELSTPQPLDAAATRKLLGPDEALISWLVLDKQTFVFAVTREGSTWQRIDLDHKDLDAAVTKLRAGLDMNAVTIGMAAKKPAQDVVFDLGAAHGLYDKLVAPVIGLVAGKHEWIVVPTRALTSLPLDVLVSKTPDHSAASPDDPVYRTASWLARDHAISVLPSVSALRALRVYAKPSHATKQMVGFADPVFSPAQLVASNDASTPAVSTQRGMSVKSYRSYFRGGAVDLDALRTGLPPLPETAAELHEVAHELKASDADLRIGADATVTAVKAMPLAQYHVVYFATHGLIAGDVDGLDEPALALSIPAKPTALDDGLLKASDVTQLTLDADWVVLSACNTAVGDTPGAEGLSGLARAFFYAGARALLVSHWPVESHAAVALTTQSFRAMAEDPKLGRAEALRRSMLALIDKGGEDAYPAIWAPFSVVGEGDRR